MIGCDNDGRSGAFFHFLKSVFSLISRVWTLFFKVRYALRFALAFGGVSALAGWTMTIAVFDDDSWKGLWMFTGTASFVVGYALSRWLVERREQCSSVRLVWVGSLIALLSHWLCWYGFLVVNYIRSEFFGGAVDPDVINPWLGLGVACGYTLFSMAFFGWLSVPTAIFLGIWLRRDGQEAR